MEVDAWKDDGSSLCVSTVVVLEEVGAWPKVVIETFAEEPQWGGLDRVAALKGSEVLDAVAARGVEHDDEAAREETKEW